MQRIINFLLVIILISFFVGISYGLSGAQVDYPTKPIQVVVNYGAGGAVDVLARALAHEANKHLGQQIVVLNKTGAAGIVGLSYVAAAKPDGYTLGATPSSCFLILPWFQDLPIDPSKETTPILSFAKAVNMIVVKSESPFKSLKDFLEYAKENPGKASYGNPGLATRPYLIMAVIAAQEGIKMNFVAFPGDAQTIAALLGGHIMAAGVSTAGLISHVKAGTIRVLASAEEQRWDPLPETPTLYGLGYPVRTPMIYFLYGPRGLPEPVAKKLEDAFNKASQSPIFRKVAIDCGAYATKENMLREELAKFLDIEKAKSGKIIQELGLGKK